MRSDAPTGFSTDDFPDVATTDPADSEGSPPHRMVTLALLAMPTLAALGSFVSLAPGSSGTLNGYRLVVGLSFLPAIAAVIRHGQKNAATRWLTLTSLAFLTWGVYALSWAPDPDVGRRQLIGIVLALMGTWVAVGLTSRHHTSTNTLRHGFVIAAGVLTCIGLWQFATGMDLWTLSGQTSRFESNMLIGSFVNPNNFAAFLLGCAGPVLSWALTSRGISRLAGLALLLSMAFVILGTTSRAGLLGLLVIVVVVLIFITARVPRLQVPIAFTVITLTVGAWLTLGRHITARLSTAFSGNSGQSDSLRVSLSETAVRYFVESGGAGIGPAGFQVKLGAESSQQVLATHNTFLQMAAEYGLPVVLPSLLLVLTLFMAAFRRSATTARVDPAKVELIAGFIAMLVGALVASSLIADPSWWLLIGYLIVLTRDKARPA